MPGMKTVPDRPSVVTVTACGKDMKMLEPQYVEIIVGRLDAKRTGELPEWIAFCSHET
jgi:hypothetical protein